MPLSIVSQRESSRFNERGNVVPVIEVIFMVGEQGPFVESFRKEDYTPGSVRDKIQARANEIREISRIA